ncbi:MAG: hypothetical protein UHN59_03295, partial [Bacteroidales bacterium]|nr:hypothetical protein [Bacteroidales bacterium]
HIHPMSYYFKDNTDKFKVEFIRWSERGNVDWDYAIICTTGIYPELLRIGTYPPKNTVYEVKVDGRPICIVLKRDQKYDWKGFEAATANDFAKAEELYKKALIVDPINETAVLELGNIYMSRVKTDTLGMNYLAKANRLLDVFILANPNHEIANYMKAHCHYMNKDIRSALATCDRIIAYNPKYESSYILASQLRLVLGDLNGAENYLLRLLNEGVIGQELVDMLVQVFQFQGLDESNAYMKLYTLLAEFYEKEGDEELAKEYSDAVETIRQSMYGVQ